jgi:MoxR-like ATPase
MKYLLEISKIIDGGLRADRTKVRAYAEQLARKMDSEGDSKSAQRVRECLRPNGAPEVAVNDLSAPAKLPVDSESRLHLADEIRPDAVAPFLALSDRMQAKVDIFIRYVHEADKLMAAGVGISPSMLIYGPPGCGKTALAKYIASTLGLPLLLARSDSLISSYLGSTAKNFRMLFEHAMSRPSVLFLDEFDAFAKLRDDQHELGELKRVVVSLLQNIDALDSRTVLIAASNHEHLLDPAVWRRFSHKINLGPPDQNAREQMFKVFLRGFAHQKSIELFAAASKEMTGAQIRGLSENAVRDAIIAGQKIVSESTVLTQIIHARAPKLAIELDSPNAMQKVRELDPKIFNGKRLATIFGTTPWTVSRKLNRGT